MLFWPCHQLAKSLEIVCGCSLLSSTAVLWIGKNLVQINDCSEYKLFYFFCYRLTNWPEDMLQDVADDTLKEVDLSGGLEDEGLSAKIKSECINMFMSFHVDALELSQK
jgi:hypothetical protein